MFDLCIENIKGILINPLKTFEQLKNSSLNRAYQHYVMLLILYSILLGIVALVSASMLFSSYEIQAGLIPIIGAILLTKLELFKPFILNSSIFLVYLWFLYLLFMIFLKGFLLHVFVILFGGEQGLKPTILAVLFATTPYLLLGWIPYIWIIGLIWTVILFIVGIKVFQDLSWLNAAAVIIIPSLLAIIGIIFARSIIFNLVDAFSSLI